MVPVEETEQRWSQCGVGHRRRWQAGTRVDGGGQRRVGGWRAAACRDSGWAAVSTVVGRHRCGQALCACVVRARAAL
jgi:hypothetical protein